MSSRNINDLHPDMKAKALQFLDLCQSKGLSILIYCTFRDSDEQNRLFAKGRTAMGPVVTWAKGGQSPHNHTENGAPAALAFDCCPLDGGKPIWMPNNPLWATVGALGESTGLEWAGRWQSSKREYPHFQMPNWRDYGNEGLP